MSIAKKIKHLRNINQMTQEDLAEKTNVSRQTVSKWETGVAIPDADHIVLLCQTFHISTDELLDCKMMSQSKKKTFMIEFCVLLVGIIGLIIFGVLLIRGKIDETSSTITLNAYGIFSLLFLILIIVLIIIMIKKHAKK